MSKVTIIKTADDMPPEPVLVHIRRFLFDRSIPAHLRGGITDEDIGIIEDFSGAENGVWDRNAEERFATAWEQYWLEGNAPNAELGGIFNHTILTEREDRMVTISLQ